MATTFMAAARGSASDPATDVTRSTQRSRRRRAFVVDDDPDARYLLGEVARDMGWQAERFPTLKAVRQAMTRDQPDLLILDDALPDGSGGDFAVEVRANERLRGTPIIFCTGATPPRRREIGRIAPVLSKPFDLGALERILSEVGTA
jgi:DNA-binding response OmpR family regulator